MTWLSRLGGAHPPSTIIVAVLATAISLLVAVPNLDRLAPADDSFPGADAVEARALVERATGLSEEPVVMAQVNVNASGQNVGTRAAEVAADLAKVPGMGAVIHPGARRPPGSPPLISADGRSALVLGYLTSDRADARGRADAAAASAKRLDGEEGVALAGAAMVEREIQQVVREDLHRAELITVPILIVLAIIIFRGVAAALVPVAIAGFATVMTLLALVAMSLWMEVSVFALNITTALATGLGIDYGLLVVSRLREERARGHATRDAVRITMATAGRAVAFSAMTVAVSLAALLIFPQPYLRSLGAAGALVAAISGISALLVAPAVLLALGDRIDSLAPRWLRRRSAWASEVHTDGGWYRLCMFVTRHPVSVAVIACAVLLLVAAPVRRAEFTTADVTVLPTTSDVRKATEEMLRSFPDTTRPTASVVVAGKEAENRARDLQTDLTQALPKSTLAAPPQALDEQTQVITLQLPTDALGDSAVGAVEKARATADGRGLVGGRTARFVEQRDSVFDHTPLAALLVVVATSICILLLTGSLVLPLKTALMNALTLGATFGMLVWVFQDGRMESLLGFTSQGALEVAQPAIVCALVFGLSTDYGVFLLARVREAVDDGLDTTEALALGVERTGRIITSAAILFCVAMSATALSRLVTVKQVGLGVAFAVLLDATIIRAFLVPALMQLLGSRNWWAPAPLARWLQNHRHSH